MSTNQSRPRLTDFFRRFLEQRPLPVMLALGAILVMLPALKAGLFADDLPQRAVELRPDQLPARMHDTGNPADSGTLMAVQRDLYFHRSPQDYALMKNYGVLPWWAPDGLGLGLWRPLTAFTFWLDYRLFPDSPALMHAENIAWFSAIVFVATVIYRKLMGRGWPAGLAALLFLLDGNTYFPVMFIANRAFMISLCLGLLCFYEHHRWRLTKSPLALAGSVLWLAFALFANEGGASALAFIFSYALVLEQGSLRQRALTVLPAIAAIIVWRIIYNLAGFGLHHVGLYIDPSIEPWEFLRVIVPRALILLGAQMSSIAPEFLILVKPSWQPIAISFFVAAAIAPIAVFLPVIRRNRIAVFWLVVTVLAAIPAVTVAPLSKNMGFVAFGAYGFIAVVVSSFFGGRSETPNRLPNRLSHVLALSVCILLLIMHVPGAIAGRILTVAVMERGLPKLDEFVNLAKGQDLENKDLIVINAPVQLALAYAPFYKMYHHEPLPKSVRTLVPGCTRFEVQRTDAQTLVIQSESPNIFSTGDLGSVHVGYAFGYCNGAIGAPQCRKGDRRKFDNLTVEVLESDESGLASRVAFRFSAPLESPDFHWLWFNWRTFSYEPFEVPAVGRSVRLAGPRR